MQDQPWLANYDVGVPYHIEIPESSVIDLLNQSSTHSPNKTCIIYKNQKVSYQTLVNQTNQLAVSLIENGLHKGDRVGLLVQNTPEFVIAFLGILKAGGVVVAINTLYKPREIIHQVNDAQVGILITMDIYYEMLKSLQKETSIKKIILVDGKRKLPSNDENLRNILKKHKIIFQPDPEILPDDNAIFQYSGGTTGISKGAIGTHRNLVANVIQFRHWLVGVPRGQEVILVAIPLFHVYGMVLGMLLTFLTAGSMVLIQDLRNFKEILQSIKKYRVNIFPGVPTLYNAINSHPDVIAGKYDLSTIQACISGSAPLLKETKDRFESLTGGKLMEGYGLSEAPTATHCNPMMGVNYPGSIGLPLPDVDARIVDQNDGITVLPPNTPGELVVRGPQVMKGYHNMILETRDTLRHGWLYTGDIAYMDEKGFFYLVDRKKDLIKPGGYQVWPRDVEEVIKLHPKVLEVSVAGVPDSYRGETVKAWIVLKPGQNSTADEIKQYCKNEMAVFKVPTLIEFRDQLPKTAVGKVLRRELVQQHKLADRS